MLKVLMVSKYKSRNCKAIAFVRKNRKVVYRSFQGRTRLIKRSSRKNEMIKKQPSVRHNTVTLVYHDNYNYHQSRLDFQRCAIWEDPENFRPERDLDEDGKLIKNDAFISFGQGRI